MSSIAIKWAGKGSQLFVGRDSFGHVVVSGSWPNEDPEWHEWRGVKPSDLLLISLGSCTAYDMVMILNKQRQDLSSLYIDVDGQQQKEPPYAITKIHVHYIVEGSELDPPKIEHAIQLSQERYCSVAATVREVADLTYSFEIKSK